MTTRAAKRARAEKPAPPSPTPTPTPTPTPSPTPLPSPTPEPSEVTSLGELEAALEADTRPIEQVQVKEWPGAPIFHVRALTGHDRDAIENGTFGEGVDHISAKIVARALVKPNGDKLVPRKELPRLEALLTQRTAGGLRRLMRVAKRLSRLDESAIEELEEILKNGQSAPSGTG